MYQDADGMYVIQGRLTPEAGALLRQALDAACDRLYGKGPLNTAEGEPPSTGQRQADALAMIAEAALHHGLDPGASGDRYRVFLHADAAVLADPDQPGQSALEEGDHGSARGRGRFPPRCAVCCDTAIAAVASRVVACVSRRAITSSIGHKAGPRRSRISRCCVGAITVQCTRTASK